MSSGDVPPSRPRRERPLRAPGREEAAPPPPPPPGPPGPPGPPSATTPPTGPPVIDFPAASDPFERDDHVVVEFAGPLPQKRWTVALRFILAIPHFIWSGLLSYAGQFVTILAWFAALFTGRVPDGMARFIARVIEYQLRVYGYSFLLISDEYPPFALKDNDYAINLRTSPGELNRAAVFFRLILMVPSLFMSGLLLVGAQMISVVGWLLTLVMGRMPTSLWQANAAALRYYARAYCFGSMLTAEQPNRVFGDSPGPDFAPLGDDGLPDLPERPRIVRLVLSKAAKRIVVLFMVATVVGYGGFATLGTINAINSLAAFDDLTEAHERLEFELGDWSNETQQCAFQGSGPDCLRVASSGLADGFAQFAEEVEAIDFPGGVGEEILLDDARRCEAALRRMAVAETLDAYQAGLAEFQDAADAFDESYATVAFETEFS